MSMQLSNDSEGPGGEEGEAMARALSVLFGIDQDMLGKYENEERVWIDIEPEEIPKDNKNEEKKE